MFKKVLAGFTASLFLISGITSSFAQEPSKGSIQIKGSDTMVNLGQAWAEEFSKKYPDVTVAVTGGGSGTGFSALINGTCDVAEASRTIKEKEKALCAQKGFEPYEAKVALDGLAVVVSPKNPVSQLTIDQLADIFTGRITNWKEVGGPNMVIVILSREVNSGTHIYFKEHVLRKGNEKGPEEFSPAALLMPSSQAIADEVSQNVNAIGYYGIGYVTPQQKALAVAKDASSPYIEPTIDNVKSGVYPISRPLLMYTRGIPQAAIKAFIDFVLSDEGQKIVSKVDFVPLS
ncbi:MAG: PstS family phosphate ABC transporter substrate-binding protein [Candidatus Omnitrophota bacterium]